MDMNDSSAGGITSLITTQIAIVHRANGSHFHSLDFFVEYMGQARSLDKLSSEWAVK